MLFMYACFGSVKDMPEFNEKVLNLDILLLEVTTRVFWIFLKIASSIGPYLSIFSLTSCVRCLVLVISLRCGECTVSRIISWNFGSVSWNAQNVDLLSGRGISCCF